LAYEQTEAIVLRKVDFSESSRIVTFLTPCRGRLTCMAKGARRKGSPLATLLDTYNRLEITCAWKDSRQVQLLTEAALLDSYGALKGNVESVVCAAFLLETAGLAAQENNPAPEIYNTLRAGLEQIAANPDTPFTHVVHGVFAVLEAAGFAPNTEDAFFAEQTRRLAQKERDALHESIDALASGGLPSEPERIFNIIRYLKSAVVYHFERPLKSYPFLESMFPNQECTQSGTLLRK